DGSESVGSFSGGRMQANGAEAYGLSPPRSSHHSTHRNRVQAREACGRPEDGGSAGVGTARLIHGCHDQSYCAPICDCFYSEGSCAVDKDRTAAGGCGELGRCESRPYIVGYERVSDATLRDPGRWSTASWGRDSVAESLHERRHLTPCHRIIGAELGVRGRVAPSSDPLVGQPRDVVVEHVVRRYVDEAMAADGRRSGNDDEHQHQNDTCPGPPIETFELAHGYLPFGRVHSTLRRAGGLCAGSDPSMDSLDQNVASCVPFGHKNRAEASPSGRGREAASCSIALRSKAVSLRHGSTVTRVPERRQVPTKSPSTITAPGHTREGHNCARWAGSGTIDSRAVPWRRKNVSPEGSSRAGAGSASAERARGSSSSRRNESLPGVSTGINEGASASKIGSTRGILIPAHSLNPCGVPGPRTLRYLRANSMDAWNGSIRGRGTVHTVGWRAPSHRIRSEPVSAPYRISLGWIPIPAAASRASSRRSRKKVERRAAMSSARARRGPVSGRRATVKMAWSSAGTT